MNERLLWLVSCNIFLSWVTYAQTVKAPESVRAPEFCSWTVAISQPRLADPAGGEELLTKIEVTKTRNIMRMVSTFSSGRTEEAWAADGNTIQLCKEGVVILNPRNDSLAPQLHRTDFEALSWISRRNCRGMIQLNDRDCYYYEISPHEATSDELHIETKFGSSIPTHQAWIDAQTLLPVKVVVADTTYSYVFGSSPSGMLVLPQAQKAMYEMFAKYQQPGYVPR